MLRMNKFVISEKIEQSNSNSTHSFASLFVASEISTNTFILNIDLKFLKLVKKLESPL